MTSNTVHKVLVETTGICDGFRYPPHTYFLNKEGKMVAFKREGEDTITYYEKPKKFDRRYRKFMDVTNEQSS